MRDHRETADEQKSFPDRATAFLKTGTGLITAVATLLVAITGLITAFTQLGGRHEAQVSTVAVETAGVPADETDAQLWSHIPASLRSTCRRSTGDEDEEGSVAAYNCMYRRIVGLQYNLFPSSGDLDDGYADVRERYGVAGSGSSCESGDFEGKYKGDGSMLCFVGEDGVAAIVWSDPEVDILSFAWRDDGKLPELYDAWKSGVGPER